MDLHETMALRFRVNLRAIRERRKLSQGRLARRIGTTNTYIYQLESGARAPSLGMLTKIAEALEVDPSVLMKAVK